MCANMRRPRISCGTESIDAWVRAPKGIDPAKDPLAGSWVVRLRGRLLSEFRASLGTAMRLVWSASPGRAILTIAVQAAASVALLFQLLLIQRVLTVALGLGRSSGSVGQAVVPVTLLAVLTAVTTIATSLGNMQERVLGEMVSREVLRHVLEVSQTIDLRAYEDPKLYDQVERVESGAASQVQVIVQALVLLIGDTLGVVAATIALVALSPELLPFLLLSGVPLLLVSSLAGRREYAFAVQQSAPYRARQYVQEVLARREGAAEVRAFSLSGPLRGRWETLYASFLVDLRQHVAGRLRLLLLGNLAAAVLTASALILAIILVDNHKLGVASAGTALVAVRLLGSRVGSATTNLGTVFESSLLLRDLANFLSRSARRVTTGLAVAPSHFRRLTASEVTFTYPGATTPSLRGVSMEIREGEVVALVGENGSGKSTLAKLLANLYEPDDGAVAWDGVDLTHFEPDTVRRRIAVIFQDFMRYHFTARENISLGRSGEDVDESVIRAAARKADAESFVSKLPAGYDTLLSKEYEGGSDLSLGQWQRLALARAFVRDAAFVILDEPSASLDARAESDLFQRIRTLSVGRTVLLISHRFSTVRTADRIYVLSEGRVLEQGDHVSLMDQGGLYAELFRLQASAYLDGGPTEAEPRDT